MERFPVCGQRKGLAWEAGVTITAKALLGFLAFCLLVGAWMGRYDVRATGAFGGALVLDRWTGITYVCNAHEINDGACHLRAYP